MALRLPLKSPMAVRHALTMTAFRMFHLPPGLPHLPGSNE
jgi:hypothetical protein